MAEKTVEEKQGSAPSSTAGTSVGRLRLFMRAWIVLAAVCLGASLYVLLLSIFIGSKEAADALRQAANLAVRADLLSVSAGVAAVLAFLGLKKLDPYLEYRKPVQARWVRTAALLATAGMTAFGCLSLYQLPTITSPWWQDLWAQNVFGKIMSVKPILFFSVGVFSTVTLFAYLFYNRQKSSDFLIETEGELKKVSWPARKDYVGSAIVVVLVVIILSTFLHFVDMGLSNAMQYLGIGF